ncbi:zuotin [Dioszegia hungarica]|uniref:Zuotin n=1 Tax=Dioszegia hungarica TaxID=4972 RepID=A0AA38HDX4_9TREE|nr:zuotin [Dioszegia hungarica]KAI9638706.1 zuotin [Dioszegia hungarica]
MATLTTLPLTLPALPSGYSAPSSSGLSKPSSAHTYPAGPSFLSSARRQLLQRSFAEDDKLVLAQRKKEAEEASKVGGEEQYPGLGEEEEDKATLAQDPKEWKKQDHYAVLGLGNLRYKATDDHIKVAHRRKVLRHHPDKKAASGSNDDGFFKCIQKAHETLTNPERRRQFDSVDEAIEDSVPNPASIPAGKYCATLAPVFAREARFSKVQPVPGFGGEDASKKEVEGFYDFWYNFDSWRSFEWHDKEVDEDSTNRDNKRFTEKKNKSERTRRKKEDNTRLRELVDSVLANDPRIKRIKAEEKAARDAKKKGGAAAAKGPSAADKKAEEDKKAKEEAAKKAAATPELSKAEKEAQKKAKEAARKNLKKWKKSIQAVIAASNYFLPAITAPSAAQIDAHLTELDTLCDLLEPEEVKDLKEKVEAAGPGEGAKTELKARVVGLGQKADGKFVEFTKDPLGA